jgi:uncharacterized protein YkwD
MLQHTSKITYAALMLVLSQGLAHSQQLPQAVTQAAGRFDTATSPVNLDEQLLLEANRIRAAAGLEAFSEDASLQQVAMAHARDMAMGGYIGYSDPVGRSLLEQVRFADRTSLISSFGSIVAVMPATATANDIQVAIQSDPGNAENLSRNFSHAGLATFKHGDRLYVVQLFARIDGALDKPLPLQMTSATRLEAALLDDAMQPLGWSVSAPSGEIVARGSGTRLRTDPRQTVEGYLNLDVAMGNEIYTLRGPFVKVSN